MQGQTRALLLETPCLIAACSARPVTCLRRRPPTAVRGPGEGPEHRGSGKAADRGDVPGPEAATWLRQAADRPQCEVSLNKGSGRPRTPPAAWARTALAPEARRSRCLDAHARSASRPPAGGRAPRGLGCATTCPAHLVLGLPLGADGPAVLPRGCEQGHGAKVGGGRGGRVEGRSLGRQGAARSIHARIRGWHRGDAAPDGSGAHRRRTSRRSTPWPRPW